MPLKNRIKCWITFHEPDDAGGRGGFCTSVSPAPSRAKLSPRGLFQREPRKNDLPASWIKTGG
jgi:hypothetical protein